LRLVFFFGELKEY